jgi:pimeloyl-ACP methyl ester carboxylesterase
MSPDGVRIAYARAGQGPPLVKAANYVTHLTHDWKGPVWSHWLRELTRDHTLIRYDERGCGLSDWEVSEFSMEAWVGDLEAVVDAEGLERFPLLGMSGMRSKKLGTRPRVSLISRSTVSRARDRVRLSVLVVAVLITVSFP